MKAFCISITLLVGVMFAYCDQVVTTLVIETSVDLKSWTPIDTNIVTSTGYAEKYRLNIYTKKIDNSFFLKALVGDYPNTATGDGIAMNTTSANEMLYYNGNDPFGLGATMAVYVGGVLRVFVTFGGNRIGQVFGLSLTPNGPIQYTGVFTSGNVYF
jgi:hypothetical protein